MVVRSIILYDYPEDRARKRGRLLLTGREMDEMLTLRVLTLTDAGETEMQNGDPRARRILERTEALTSEAMLKAHGVIRSLREIRRRCIMIGDWNPLEETKAAPESVRILGVDLRVGDRVLLSPQKKAPDIMDMALAGKVAVIGHRSIEQDFEVHRSHRGGVGRRPGPGVRQCDAAGAPLFFSRRGMSPA